MSALPQVLEALRAGVSVDRLPARLGLDDGLVELALETLVQSRQVTPATFGCGTCAPSPERPRACAGCPFSA